MIILSQVVGVCVYQWTCMSDIVKQRVSGFFGSNKSFLKAFYILVNILFMCLTCIYIFIWILGSNKKQNSLWKRKNVVLDSLRKQSNQSQKSLNKTQ